MQKYPVDAATSVFDLLGGYPDGRIRADGDAGVTSEAAETGRIGSKRLNVDCAYLEQVCLTENVTGAISITWAVHKWICQREHPGRSNRCRQLSYGEYDTSQNLEDIRGLCPRRHSCITICTIGPIICPTKDRIASFKTLRLTLNVKLTRTLNLTIKLTITLTLP